jgi:hypothetical protein
VLALVAGAGLAAVYARAGEWIRYATAYGAEYGAIACSPDTVHRDG